MAMDEEDFKERIRGLVGDNWWRPLPEIIRFQSEYLSREGALVFALEHCVFADRFPRYFANVTGLCPHLDVRQYLIENNYIEEVRDPTIRLGHYESLVEFAVALGATRDEVYNHRPSITTIMGLAYFENISRSRPWLEGFASLPLLELTTNDALAGRYGQVPLNSPKRWAALGLQGEAMSHWRAAEIADSGSFEGIAGHGEEALALAAKYARTDEEQEAVIQTALEGLQVFKYQYDAIGRGAIQASLQARAAV